MAYIGLIKENQTDAFGNLAVTTVSPRMQLQFPYTINSDITITSVTGSGTVSHSVPFAVLSTTATTSSSARLSSKDNLHYRSGQGGLCLFTAIYTAGVANSVQEVGLGDDVHGFFFGYNGTSFGINRRRNSVDNYIPQTTWNKDKMDGTGSSGVTLDPTKGSVYKIQYQWLGFGAINFYIESQYTGQFVLVHQIAYSNLSTETSVINPSSPLTGKVLNTTNNTNIVIKISSMAAFVEGTVNDLGIINAINSRKTGVTTEINVLTIKNNATFGGITNRKFVTPNYLSISNTSNSDALFRIVLNATIGGAPSFTDISTTNSVMSYDVAGTTVADGRLVGAFYINSNTQIQLNLENDNLSLNNSDRLTISATSLGSAIIAATAINWTEKF